MAFVDLEKAFDRASRSFMWQIFRSQGVLENLVDLIQDLYRERLGHILQN